MSGDEDLSTPLRPTLKDCGNVNMAITLEYSDMVQQGVPGPKIISTFDAKLSGRELEFVSEVAADLQRLPHSLPPEAARPVHPPTGHCCLRVCTRVTWTSPGTVCDE